MQVKWHQVFMYFFFGFPVVNVKSVSAAMHLNALSDLGEMEA